MLHIPKLTREGNFVHITFTALEATLKHTYKAAHDSAAPHVICDGAYYHLTESNNIWSCEVPCSVSSIIYGEHIYVGEI